MLQLPLLRDHGVGRASALADGLCTANPSTNRNKVMPYSLLSSQKQNTLNNKANQLRTKKTLDRERQLKYCAFRKYL